MTNVALGPAFPHGLFVTQDGLNDPEQRDAAGNVREGTNFKLVPWEDIDALLPR